ncbi:MAG TPA: hypothetical protein VNQ79_14075 [Blastocatellia bacterium]|nr:hypothetical protein [Blastocatellia bacterium]
MAMSRSALIEARLSALEAEVARMKQQVETVGESGKDWLDEVYGSFANDPDYDKAMELGRKYRESLRPKAARKKNRAVKKKTVKGRRR